MEPLHVGHALKDLRRLLGRIAGPDVDFVIDVEDGLPPVRFDRGAFRSVVVELVRTASAPIVDHGRIAVRASSGPGSVVLTVADSGPGRLDDELPGPFELFHASTSRGGGAAAGLAAVSDILASSGAHVEVTATPGGGSRFSIYLPLWA